MILVCSVRYIYQINLRMVNGMVYVGIDVASQKHDCFFMNDKDVNANMLITINNDIDGFKKLEESIHSFMKKSR